MLISTDVPQSYEEATSPGNADVCMPAIRKEESSIERNQTWDFVRRTSDMNVLPCMDVLKLNDSGPTVRIVPKGCRQVHGVDYEETYVPVVKFTSVRVMLATAAVNDLDLHEMDVVTTLILIKISIWWCLLASKTGRALILCANCERHYTA